MTRLTKGTLWLALLLVSISGAGAFSLIGPFKLDANDPWQGPGYGNQTQNGQPQGLGYQLDFDIGGPMFKTEAYRWNVPVITYAFDSTFLNYFGTNGVAAVEEAFRILNDLPPASQMSDTLTEYPLDTKSENGSAVELGLLDLKSYTLAALLEQLGLANPERFVWGLRGRFQDQDQTNYTMIQLNYDPVTTEPTAFVNGLRYNYVIKDAIGPVGEEWASAVEWYRLDPFYQPYSSVAGGLSSSDEQLGSEPSDSATFFFGAGLGAGQYYSGLTRDDVGGLRFLLSPTHMVFDTLLPTVLPRSGSGRGGSPWAPYINTNAFGTNVVGTSNILTITTNFQNIVRTAYRPGVDKIEFKRVHVFGTNFTPTTLKPYTDRFINPTNGRIVKQTVERLILRPDIIFDVRNLGTIDEVPVRSTRTDTSNWTNNAALNSYTGAVGLGGPGTINPPVVLSFSNMLPFWLNLAEGEGETPEFKAPLWGSFDGTSRPPVIYPVNSGLTLEYLQDVVLRRNRN